VKRGTFHNDESGFCVLRVKARGHRDLVTVVGHAAAIAAGEWITATGEWFNDRTHGLQFKARFFKITPPTTAEGIEKYLSSGMIRGIGPVYAKKMVYAFGERVFDLIEAKPERLPEVDGISAARAVRICKTSGADASQVMTDNPYHLARDVRGIGFRTADAIAMKLGIEQTAMIRFRAGSS
jgi:exodeoxyribonuclease V alpha subunit